MTSPATSYPRPRGVDIAFWLLVVGAVLLVLSGLFAVTAHFDAVRAYAPASVSDAQVQQFLTFHRGAGVVCLLAGAALGFLAGRMRLGDVRFRNATVALAVVIVLLVLLIAVFSMVDLLSVLALIPVIAGAVLLTRPAAGRWFAGEAGVEKP